MYRAGGLLISIVTPTSVRAITAIARNQISNTRDCLAWRIGGAAYDPCGTA